MMNVAVVVPELDNFIGSKGMNHHQFKDFFGDNESEHGLVLFCVKVGCSSHGQMLKTLI
jgi:hypothetical protein